MKNFKNWKPSRKILISIFILLILATIFVLTQIDYGCDWTGFGRCIQTIPANKEIRPAKSLWDWMNLLIVPTLLTVGAVVYNRIEKQNEQRRTEDHLQETVLSAYLDRIATYLLNNKLRSSKGNSAVQDVAHGWTLTVLPRLNGQRKGVVLHFLYGANLLMKNNSIIQLGDADLSGVSLNAWLENIYLNGANMEKADLEGCYFWGADLSAAYLKNANLENANLGEVNLEGAWLEEANLKTFSISGNLKGAKLMRADLTGTDLSGVDLSGADLQDAKVTSKQLSKALSLKGAIMPDGSKHK
ncbi:MAG: pentapeptide repeat-containing protein [Chloroflexota bacterium]